MALSIEGWSQGILDLFTLIIGCTLGISLIYKAKKTRSHVLLFAGLYILIAGLSMLGVLYDFFVIIATGKNSNNYILIVYLSYMWGGILGFCGLYIGAELMIPEKKWYIVLVILVISIIYTILVFIDPLSFVSFIHPKTPGETPLVPVFTFGTPVFYIMIISIFVILIFNGFRFLYKSFKSAGVIRKKFLFLSLGFSFYFIGVSLMPVTVTDPPLLPIIVIKIIWTSGLILFYIGFKIELTKTKTIPTHKKAEHKKSKTTLIETLDRAKPAEITEEEVSLYRDQAICLVCKGEATKFTFICDNCKALYCETCARALINLENACWVCGVAIDDSKPVKPFEKEEEEIQVDTAVKSKK